MQLHECMKHSGMVIAMKWSGVVERRLCKYVVPRGASAAAAYQKLFRGAAHLVPSQSAPQAKCKARSETAACAFLVTQSGRTGKYACHRLHYDASDSNLAVPAAELWEFGSASSR